MIIESGPLRAGHLSRLKWPTLTDKPFLGLKGAALTVRKDLHITQLYAQGPCRTCIEGSKDEEEAGSLPIVLIVCRTIGDISRAPAVEGARRLKCYV